MHAYDPAAIDNIPFCSMAGESAILRSFSEKLRLSAVGLSKMRERP